MIMRYPGDLYQDMQAMYGPVVNGEIPRLGLAWLRAQLLAHFEAYRHATNPTPRYPAIAGWREG